MPTRLKTGTHIRTVEPTGHGNSSWTWSFPILVSWCSLSADEIISCLICKECKSLQIQSFSWRLLKLCLVSVLLEVSAHEQEYSLDLLYTESVMRCYDGIFVTDISIRWPVAEEDTPVNKQVYLKLALFSLRRLYSLTCLTKLWAPFFGLLHINSSSCWLFHVCLPPELQC